MSRPRLAILASHPIQYQAPLFRAIEASGKVDLEVLFLSDFGVDASFDPGFGREVRFDVPLTEGFAHRFVPNHGTGGSIQPPFGLVNPDLVRLLTTERYDAVVVQGYAHASDWIAFASAVAAGVRILLRGETPEPSLDAQATPRWRLKREVLGTIVRHADACLAIGLRNARFFFALGATSEQVVWAPYSVDNEHFAAGGAKGRAERVQRLQALGLDPGRPVVLSASKLIPRKRPLDVVAAMDRVHGDASLIIIGDGEQRDEIERLLPDRPWMRSLGFVNQQELSAWYGVADIFTLTSSHETWGLTVNEAMCAGAVPIVSDVVGCVPDLVADGSGRVFATGDVDDLARAIDELLDPVERQRAQAEASARISRYGLAATVGGIEIATTTPAAQRPRKRGSNSFG